MVIWAQKLKRTLVLGLLIIAGLSACHKPPPPRDVVIRAGRLIDVENEVVLENQRITIHDGLITKIVNESEAPLPEGALIVDAQKQTVMPGLIDAHKKILGSLTCHPDEALGSGPKQELESLYYMLRAGITTSTDANVPINNPVGLRNYSGTGRHRGPRLLVSGPPLAGPGYYGGGDREAIFVEISDATSAEKTVLEQSLTDVDLVKVRLSEYSYSGGKIPLMSREILCSIVEEAHRQQLRVTAEAATLAAIQLALECQVDVLENILADISSEEIAEELSKTLAERKIPVIITTSFSDSEPWKTNLGRLVAAHVLLAFGITNLPCPEPSSRLVRDLKYLENKGSLSPIQILRAATLGSAHALGLGDALGKAKTGFRADLIAIDGKPDEDLEDLNRISWVMIDGVMQNPEKPGLLQNILLRWEILLAGLKH